MEMSRNNKFNKESQDARRHDQQHAVHPDSKLKKHEDKSKTAAHSKPSEK